MICKLQSNVTQKIVEILYNRNRIYVWIPKSARALKDMTGCTIKNGDMLQLLRWATKRLSRSTWHADI